MNTTIHVNHRTSGRGRLAVATTLLVMVGAGCSERGTTEANDTDFDAPSTRRDLETVTSVMNHELWQSIETVNARVGGGIQVGGLLSADLVAFALTPDEEQARSAAARAARGVLALTRSASPRLPFEIRGLTFVIDPEVGRYVPDLERQGAPENGVRFVLYAVNPVTGQPVLDTEIGFMELTDEGDDLPTGIALRFRVVSDDITFFDYRVTTGGTETAGMLDVTGTLTDGETAIDFRIDVDATHSEATNTMDLVFALEVADRGFAIDARVSNMSTETGGSGEVELAVTTESDTFEFTASHDEEMLDASFTVNGNLFATVSGDPAAPEIRGADGEELTQDEMAVVGQLSQLNEHVFRLLHNLLEPAGAILSLRVVPLGQP